MYVSCVCVDFLVAYLRVCVGVVFCLVSCVGFVLFSVLDCV